MSHAHTSLFVNNLHGNMTIADQKLCTGRVFFVDSSATSAGDTQHHGRSQDQPFATLAYAATQCLDLRGDWIVLGPDHAEVVATAGGIGFGTLGVPVRCVTIFGVIGHGNEMPTVTFEAGDAVAGVDINIDSDGIKFQNIHFLNSEDGATGPLDVNGVNCTFENCIFEEPDTAVCAAFILNVADGLTVKNCLNIGTATAGSSAWISSGAASRVRITGNQSFGDFDAANIQATAALTNIIIDDNRFENVNAVDVNMELFAATTGFVTRNYCRIATDTQVTWLNTQGNVMVGQNYGVNNVGECGMLIAPGGVSV